MPRVRGIIIDNSGASDVARKSSIFLNTTSTANNFLYSTLGQKSVEQKEYTIKRSGEQVQIVTSAEAWIPATSVNVVEIVAEMRGTNPAPDGSSIVCQLKYVRGTGARIAAQSIIIPAKSVKVVIPCDINFLAGDKIYIDVISVGKKRPGFGLFFLIKYYK